jgi:tetratricopeptide (TPR) repeat protein
MSGEEPAGRGEETRKGSAAPPGSMTPDLTSESFTQTKARRHHPFAGLTPAGIALPLAIVGLLIYFIASGNLGQKESASPQLPRRTTVAGTPMVSAGSTATAEVTSGPPLSVEEFTEQLGQAEHLTHQSKFEQARAIYESLVRRAPEDAPLASARAETGWAWSLILDGQAGQALEHAHRAVELDPLSAATMAVLARAYLETGDKERALGMAQNAVQLAPGNAEAHAVLAEAYLMNGQKQEAVKAADLALTEDAKSAEAHRVRGWLYVQVDGDPGRALGELQIAASLQPALWLRQYELGLILIKAREYAQAIRVLTDALALRSQGKVYAAVGEAYYRLNDMDRARSFLLQALSNGARDANTYALLSLTSAREGRCDEAKLHYEQALAQDAAQRLALQARSLCQRTGLAPNPSPTPPATAQSSLGGRIAFPVWNGKTGQYDVYVASVGSEAPDGTNRHLVIEGMHQPAFSPDGRWLAVNGERPGYMNLSVVRPDGTGLQEITEYIEDGLPSWSPDGEGLVFSSTRHQDRRSRLYIVDRVSFEGERQQGRVLNSDLYEVLGEYPAWTTGGQIIYNGCDYTRTPAQCGLFSLPAAPGLQTPTQLTSFAADTAPAAHGDQIAFMSDRDGNWEIYLMNRDGSGLKRLTDNAANDGLPCWSPDGQALAFVSDQGGVWAVWTMQADGSQRRKLFDLGGEGLASDWQHERISWGP